MTPPKKKSIIIWNGINAGDIKKAEYISVDHLKEWIEENGILLGSVIETDALLKFIDEP